MDRIKQLGVGPNMEELLAVAAGIGIKETQAVYMKWKGKE